MKIRSETSKEEFSRDLSVAAELMGQVLRPQSPPSLRSEFPLVFGSLQRGDARIVLREGRPVSGAAFIDFECKTFPETALKVGAIGSVATHPDYRRQGLASQVLRECETALREKGCQISLLWSQVPDLYRRNGYVEAGTEFDFLLSDVIFDKFSRPEGVVLPFDREKDLQDCHKLYEKQALGVNRTLDEFDRLCKIPEMSIYVHHRKKEATAYAVMGKGADFQGAIHEWGGSWEGLLAILWEIFLKRQPKNLVLICPALHSDVIVKLDAAGFSPLGGILGMMKVLDPEGLLAQISFALKDRYGIEVREESGRYLLQSNSGEQAFEEGEFLRFLFGYRGISGEAMMAAKSLSAPALKQDLPVHLFFWGLDSV